jgi:hypothetical protein
VYGPDQEAFLTLAAVEPPSAANEEIGVVLKAAVENNVLLRGIKVMYAPGRGEVRVFDYGGASGWRQVGAAVPATYQPGDRLGVHAHSSGAVELFRNEVQIGAVVVDPALGASGGSIGIALTNSPGDGAGSDGAATIDNFGGGDVTGDLPPPYTVSVQAFAAGPGSVGVTPSGAIACGELVTITAQPAAGAVFVGWTGDILANDNPLTYNLYGSLIVQANFAAGDQAPEYTVEVAAQGGGAVTVKPPGPYYPGQVVEMNASAENGWRFDGWRGFAESRDNPLRVQVTGNLTATATFVRATNLYLPRLAKLEAASPITGTAESCQ